MKFLTDFGDQAVVFPITAAVTVTLLLLRWWRGAIGWFLAVSGTFATVLSLKIIFYACHAELPHVGIRSPSGHTASATVVYGGLLALVGVRGIGETIRHVGHLLLILLTALLFALVFGFSRVDLGVHTVPDVLAGGAVGMLGAVLLVLMAGAAPKGFRRWPLAAVVLVIAVLLHGHELHAEETIRRVAINYWWPFIASCQRGQA
jgi:membrane-associated phospholipid phosphatase